MDSPNQTKEKGFSIVDHGIDIIGDEWDEGCTDNISSGTDDDHDDTHSNNRDKGI